MMPEQSATSTYTIAEPFEQAAQLVRKVLTGANLKITGELNLSGRLQRVLLVQTAPCVVLFACPATAPGGFPDDLREAALTPLHVVISGRGSQTDVHILRVLPRDPDAAVRVATPALSWLLSTLAQAFESVGMRARLGA